MAALKDLLIDRTLWAMDRHVMGFGKYSFYVMQPLGTCPLGFSKRPLIGLGLASSLTCRVRVNEFEFGVIANVFFGI